LVSQCPLFGLGGFQGRGEPSLARSIERKKKKEGGGKYIYHISPSLNPAGFARNSKKQKGFSNKRGKRGGEGGKKEKRGKPINLLLPRFAKGGHGEVGPSRKKRKKKGPPLILSNNTRKKRKG